MVYKYGLLGIACGTMISMLYRFVYLSFYVDKNILKSNHSRLIKICIFDTICYVSIVYFARLLNCEVSTPFINWLIQLGAKTIVAVFIVFVLIIVMYPGQIQNLINILKNEKKRK